MFKSFLLSLAVGLTIISNSAQAHFQMLYTPDLSHQRGEEISLKMPFSHPSSSGNVMDIIPFLDFYQVHKSKQTSLLDKAKQIKWTSSENTGIAYDAVVDLKGLGDYIFIVEPEPWFAEDEDIYIQQITKTIVNVGGLPTDWNSDLGLKAEIVPLTKPYAIYEGGTFTAVVKSKGKPVPFAEIEVEYMNYTPDIVNNSFGPNPKIKQPTNAFITMTFLADANGTFTFGLPKAGHWGFAALGVGPDTEYKGKELSQDAVIWVQAYPVE